MLIAQITDVHLGFEPNNPAEFNRKRLDQTLRALMATKPRPDLLLVTGDLVDTGDDDVSYGRLKEALSALPFPVWFAMGNHDSRGPFLEHFPHIGSHDGFIQYAIEEYPVRIIVLDTLEEGRHGGAFCETRAAWLRGAAGRAARPADHPRPPPPADRIRAELDDRKSRSGMGRAAARDHLGADQYRRDAVGPSPPHDRGAMGRDDAC